MDESKTPNLSFAPLKTRNKVNDKARAKPPPVIPYFDGLRNPFNKFESSKPVTSENPPHSQIRNSMDIMKKSAGKDIERGKMLEVLRLEKNKAPQAQPKVPPLRIILNKNQHKIKENKDTIQQSKPVKKASDVTQTFKPPRRNICKVFDCQFCTAEKCGTCINCVNTNKHNKCVLKMCPRLNKKFHNKPFHSASGRVIGEMLDIENKEVDNGQFVTRDQLTNFDKSENSIFDISSLGKPNVVNIISDTRVNPKINEEKNDQLQTEGESGIHLDKTSYPCVQCGKVFKYLGNLSSHLQKGCIKSGEVMTFCPSCSIQLRKSSLSRHIKSHQKTRFHCSQCSKKFKLKETLERHVKKHQPKTCDVCNETFKSPFMFRRHNQQVHSNAKKKKDDKVNKTCDDCGIVFNRPWRLIEHLRLVHGEIMEPNIKTFKCKHCNITMSSDISLKTHLSVKHSDLGLKCTICPKVVFSKQSLSKHIKCHSDETEQEITVVMCGMEGDDTTSDIVRRVNESTTHGVIKSVEQKVVHEVFKVNRRIKQNISLDDFEEDGEDASYIPPKGIV